MPNLSGNRRKRESKKVWFADDSKLETIHWLTNNNNNNDESDVVAALDPSSHANNETTDGAGTDQTTGQQQRATSEVTVLSSAHGRARRELRDVAIFDLQSAVKHGVKSRAHDCRRTGMPRYKYVYANVVYITDWTGRTEVTSYKQSVDIVPATIASEMMDRHLKDTQTVREDPHLCASHTIVVIDQSGSMRASDVPGFKTRSSAAYGVLALEYVADAAELCLNYRGSVVVYRSIEHIQLFSLNSHDFPSSPSCSFRSKLSQARMPP